MGRLGNHFPDDQKREYARASLVAGQVFYLWCDFTTTPKDKYVVLVCPDTESPLFFVVNSSVHPFVARKPDVAECQVELRACDYDFLHHDSFLNCAEVIDCFSEAELVGQLQAGLDRIKGRLNDATAKCVIKVVQNARTISPRHKKAIRSALSSAMKRPLNG